MEKRVNSFIVVGVAAVLGISAFYAINNTDIKLSQQSEKPAEVASAQTQFDEILKTFLADVNKAVGEYRAERKIIVESVKPENLQEPAYVEENYDMVRALLPSLRKRKDVIFNAFDVTEVKVQELVAMQPEADRQPILDQWAKLKQEQMNLYQNFFTAEDEIIKAYDNLLTFYYSKRYEFTVDLEKNTIVFKTPEDNDRARLMQDTVASLHAKQSEVLQN